ncbi:MAG: hypothetical protein HN521_25500 [Candidatus Latescibacteria bacterium]|jgi:hypothetical protein|nr:hypothetical protein [Candidatus Latescibacterota bacterium]
MKRMCVIFGMVFACMVGAVLPGHILAQTVLLDANLLAGYQGQDGLVDIQSGQRVALEVYGKEINGVSGFSVQVTYAAIQLQFDGFTSGSLIPGFTGLTTQTAGAVEIGGASVDGAAQLAQGRLGVVHFLVLDGFTGNVAVSLGQGQVVKGTSTASLNAQAQVVVGLPVTGPIMMDADVATGLQAVRRVVDVNVGDNIAVEVYGRGIVGASGFAAIIEYDTAQLSLEGFDATQIIPGFTGLRVDASGAVEIGGASVTGVSGASEGRLGVLRFKVLPGFSGEASIELIGGRLTLGTDINNYTSDQIVSVSGIAGGSIVKTPDFNGNGVVDFPDFLVFAAGFGKTSNDPGFQTAIDLNDNGAVDFPDFLTFAQQFGKSVGK